MTGACMHSRNLAPSGAMVYRNLPVLMRLNERGAMFIRHGGYVLSDLFVGFVWKGEPIIGVDLDDDAWGLVIWRWYAGYKFRED